MNALGKTGLPNRCEVCIDKVQKECQRQINEAQQRVQEIDMHLLAVAMQRAGIDKEQRAIVYGQLPMIKRDLSHYTYVSELEPYLTKNEEDFEQFKDYFNRMARIKEK